MSHPNQAILKSNSWRLSMSNMLMFLHSYIRAGYIIEKKKAWLNPSLSWTLCHRNETLASSQTHLTFPFTSLHGRLFHDTKLIVSRTWSMKTPILANHYLCKVSDVMHKETDITQRGGAESMYGFFYYIYPHIAIFFGGVIQMLQSQHYK